MEEIYNEQYYKTHLGPIPCSWKSPEWRSHNRNIARKLIEKYQPMSFVDAGCSIGLLVHEFANLGIIASGFDISSYAIEVAKSNGVICFQQSLVEPYEGKADLVTCIEIVEHIPAEHAAICIQNLCNIANFYVVFSSSPDDEKEETHCNVQPAEYWVKLFVNNGFLPIDKAEYISPHATVFKRNEQFNQRNSGA